MFIPHIFRFSFVFFFCDLFVALGAMSGCVISVQDFGFCRHGATFICVWVIQTSKVYLVKDKKSKQWSIIWYRFRVIGILVTIVTSNV